MRFKADGVVGTRFAQLPKMFKAEIRFLQQRLQLAGHFARFAVPCLGAGELERTSDLALVVQKILPCALRVQAFDERAIEVRSTEVVLCCELRQVR